jgi:sulfoxide reductase heme-binding subunit YedZ
VTLWFLARAAGFVALLAASVTVALGALGSSSRPDGRILAQLVHRSAAVLTLALLGLHAGLLVTDSYVDVSTLGAVVPFTAGYRGNALALGTLAVYGFLVVAATGAARGRLAASARAARAWRAVHLSAYAAWGLAMTHGVLAGTDTLRGWALAIYGVSAFLVGGALAARVSHELASRRTPLVLARRLSVTRTAGLR